MLKLADLLLKRLIDPGNRSAELIRVSIEEAADPGSGSRPTRW
jgi:hypothetical protein